MLRRLKEHLSTAQAHMKAQTDKNRSERSFVIGDWVYLRLQPFRKTSLSPGSIMKLAPKFYCPYQVVQKVCPVAYKLDLSS